MIKVIKNWWELWTFKWTYSNHTFDDNIIGFVPFALLINLIVSWVIHHNTLPFVLALFILQMAAIFHKHLSKEKIYKPFDRGRIVKRWEKDGLVYFIKKMDVSPIQKREFRFVSKLVYRQRKKDVKKEYKLKKIDKAEYKRKKRIIKDLFGNKSYGSLSDLYPHLNGYVTFPKKPFEFDDYMYLDVQVHGGLTYAQETDFGTYTFGFDTAHAWDNEKPHLKDLKWLKNECESMGKQIQELAKEYNNENSNT